jgi:hypothetical protein
LGEGKWRMKSDEKQAAVQPDMQSPRTRTLKSPLSEISHMEVLYRTTTERYSPIRDPGVN